MFDCAASIETENEFDDLSVGDLAAAMRKRLDQIELEGEIGAFGFCDEYELGHE
jgi:hypothetical protein